jgi:hypothetical protein
MGSWLLESGIQQVRYLLLAALLLLAVPAQAQDELLQRNQARQFESQVVRVLPRRNDGTTAQAGFGIIVGQRGNLLIVAVPAHVVWDSADELTDRPMVRFRADRLTDIAARRFNRRLPPPDDLALLEVPLPAGMTVPRATIVPDTVLATRFVFAIGAGDDWEVSARAGTFGGVEQNRQWRFGSLNITPGTSGGAIVTSDGIAAMVLTTTGNRSFALPASRMGVRRTKDRSGRSRSEASPLDDMRSRSRSGGPVSTLAVVKVIAPNPTVVGEETCLSWASIGTKHNLTSLGFPHKLAFDIVS